MRLIVDTNVLMSALIKDAATRKIIVESAIEFYAPEIIKEEIFKYKELILKKSKSSEKDFIELFQHLFKHVELIPNDEIILHVDKAKEIMYDIDPNDVLFIAAALSGDYDGIWSNDTDFDKQNAVNVFKTSEVLELDESSD